MLHGYKDNIAMYIIPYGGKLWWGKCWQIDSFQVFGKRKFGELIDQPIDY